MPAHGSPPLKPQQSIWPSWPPHHTQGSQKHWYLVEAAVAGAAVVAAAGAVAAVAAAVAAVGEEAAEEDSLHPYPQHQASEMATEVSKAIRPQYSTAIAAKAINS